MLSAECWLKALGGCMHYRYAVNHHVSMRNYLRILAKSIAHNITAPLVSPLNGKTKFCFVAGCGHSGTTLLASRLANHPEAFLIARETGAFFPDIGLYGSKLLVREWAFMAKYLSKQWVIEKTPKHLHCARRIKRVVPDAKVVVTVRNPLDNIASLFKRFGDLKYCIERWCLDNQE